MNINHFKFFKELLMQQIKENSSAILTETSNGNW